MIYTEQMFARRNTTFPLSTSMGNISYFLTRTCCNSRVTKSEVIQPWRITWLYSNLVGLFCVQWICFCILFFFLENKSFFLLFVPLFSLQCLSPLFWENIFKADEGGCWRGFRWGDEKRKRRKSPMQAHRNEEANTHPYGDALVWNCGRVLK